MLLGAGLLLLNLCLALYTLSTEIRPSIGQVSALFLSPLVALASMILAGVLLSPLPGIGAFLLLTAVLLVAMLSAFFAFSVLGEGPGGEG